MKIPHPLPQFEHGTTLLIVAGKQDAVLYRARSGVIERLLDVKVSKPHYSDDEGHFKVRSAGKVIRSGSVKEIRDDDIIRDFLHALNEKVMTIPEDFAEIHLFAPERTKNVIGKALPKSWQERIVEVIEGNFYYRNPLYLLERIASANPAPERYLPERKEAKEILQKADKAREVIRAKH